MILLPILMKKHRHKRNLAEIARRLPEPRNYYAGCRRPAVDLPDNLLVFCRRSETELHDGSLQPHFHHRWVLIVPLRGAGTVHLDGRAHALRPGMTLLVPPLRLHRYSRVDDGAIVWLFVTFDLTERDKRAAVAEISSLSAEARRWVARVLDLWRQPEAKGSELATTVALLLLALRRKRRSQRTATVRLLERVNQWLAMHRAEPVTLGDLARGLGMSASHLRAVFRQEHGLSLGRYVRETRCRQAAVLLRAGTLTVTAAAAALGFRSVYAFSRTFKRVLGVSPIAMRS